LERRAINLAPSKLLLDHLRKLSRRHGAEGFGSIERSTGIESQQSFHHHFPHQKYSRRASFYCLIIGKAMKRILHRLLL
jgi:hypothetical protein